MPASLYDLPEAVKSKKNPLGRGGGIMTLFETILVQGNITQKKTKRSAKIQLAEYGTTMLAFTHMVVTNMRDRINSAASAC